MLAFAAACASVPEIVGVEIVIAPDSAVDEDVLRLAAAHELRAFVERGRTESDLADAADSMARRLREDGYASARVDHALVPAGEGAAPSGRLVVAEGPRAVIGEVTFPGASAFSEADLRAQFVPTDVTAVVSDVPLRVGRIDAGVAATVKRYRAAGYVDAEAGPARIAWNAERTRADVEVPVSEGRRWTVSRVRVEGTGDEALARRIEASLDLVGRPFTPRSANVAAARARRLLANRGHLDARAEATAVRDAEAATASIEVRVTPGPVARAGAVRFEGLDRTDEDFLLGLVHVERGQVLSQDRIDAATEALNDTGVFRSVAVEARRTGEVGGDAAVVTDLEAAVREVVARTLDFELGYGSYEMLRGRVRYLDRNFLGRAVTWDSDVTASFRGAALGTRYDDPYLLGEKVVLSFGATVFARENPDFTESGAEFQTSVGHEFSEHVHAAGGYRLRTTKATDVEGAIAGAESGSHERAGGLFARVEDDRTDDAFFPRRGTISALEAFWSSPALGADLDFLELTGAMTCHVPLARRTTLVLAGRAATREILDDRRTLPIQERYFIGGEDSVRSFEQDELAPLDEDGDAAGGLTAVELHAELRQRLQGNLDCALFYDVGWVSPQSLDLGGAPGQAIGVGLRYRLPVGPFRVDVAWNPGELYAADSRWAVHVSFGFAF